MKVTGIFNIKGRGWVLSVDYPLDIKLPEFGQNVLSKDGIKIGTVRAIEMFVKNITRGENIGIVLGSCSNKPECKEVYFK